MWYNIFMIGLMRSPLHGLLDKNFMLLTYFGCKSGKRYTIPVNYLRLKHADPNELTTLSLCTRTWWRNLRDKRPYCVQLRGEENTAIADVIEDQASIAELLAIYLKLAPKMGRYFNVRMDNGLPNANDLAQAAKTRVVILTRIEG
jgi:hypothetical protein